MGFNGKDDYLARWIHGLCAIPLSLFLAVETYLVLNGNLLGIWTLCKLSFCGYGIYFIWWRLLRYALTGRGNINNEL